MSASPTVSIITPAFNAAAYIDETAQSVLAQTFHDWEWIIADDGSTDATRDIVRALADPRITLIAAEHSGLPAVARNLAIARARGRFLAFLDADDLWMPDKLAAQLAFFDTHTQTGLVFSTALYFFEDMNRRAKRAVPSMRGVPNPGMLFTHLCDRNLICTSSMVVRRALIDAHGAFDEDPRQRGTEDYELWLRLAPHTELGCIERPLVTYRFTAQSLSGNSVAITQGRILALEKAIERNPDVMLPRRLTGERRKARELAWLGYAQLRDGVDDRGRRAFGDSLRIDVWNPGAWVFLALSYLSPSLIQRLRRIAYRLF